MKRILAIAAISLRTAVRSRVVIALLVVLLITIVGLPMTIKGDGTVLGEVQVMLTYTLGLVALLLSIVSLWAGCSAISHEVAERQIHLVVTKPVGRFQIWAGKWIGLLILNAVLLSLSGATVAGLLYWKATHSRYTETELDILRNQVLVARELVRPNFPDVTEEARELLQQQIEAKAVPEGMSEVNGLTAMRRVILTRRFTAAPNYSLQWTFNLEDVPPDRPIHLRFRLSTSTQTDRKIDGLWSFGPPGVSEFDQLTSSAPKGHHTLSIPPEAVDQDGTLQVRYTNLNRMELSVLFDPVDGISTFVYRGSFAGNLVRALLIIFFRIALLAAIGVTAGALLSMPVASFTALFAMVLLQSIGYVESLARRTTLFPTGEAAAAPGISDYLFGLVFKFMSLVIAPLDMSNPLDQVGVGELVPWALVGTVFLVKLVIYGGAIGLIGSWLFNRRELGLPS